VACLWQAFPNKTNKAIKDLIIKSADRYLAPTTQYGYGIPDFTLALSNGLGVNDFSKADTFLYPNPVSDFDTISFSENFDTGVFRVYTILGQKMMEQTITKSSPIISLKALQSGVYIYKMDYNGNTKTGKLIKQ
jgi:hypothetical protein